MPFCRNCGSEVLTAARICPACSFPQDKTAEGTEGSAAPPPVSPPPAETDSPAPAAPVSPEAAVTAQLRTPEDPGPSFRPTVGNTTTPTGGIDVARTEGLAIASLVCGIVGLIAVPLLPSIAAIVLGRQARTRIEESRGGLEGTGMAKAGFVLGIVGVVFWAIIAVLAIIGLAIFVMLAPEI